jgi:2-keto-4-pentenoate hydratase/2-oxohepta-3-ene-1,7-dioic acid hydratase in catechol pathway
MLLVRYQALPSPNYGVLEDGQIYEAVGHPPFGRFTRGLLVAPLEQVELLAPVVPGKIVALGRNYAAHAEEHDAQVPEEPLIFLKAPSSLLDPGGGIALPALSERVEHEAELALVIGRRCRHVRAEDAWEVLLGVTCANDVTARDLQRKDGQWARAKSFDTFCPLGPAIVTHLTPSQIESLELLCRVNGKIRQRGNTSQMVFSIPEILAYVTAVMTLEPGDVILTGTPSGVGPLRAGDEVEVEIEGVGLLRNRVVEG